MFKFTETMLTDFNNWGVGYSYTHGMITFLRKYYHYKVRDSYA